MPRKHPLHAQLSSPLRTVNEYGGLKAENFRVSRMISQQSKARSIHLELQKDDTRLLLRGDVRRSVSLSIASDCRIIELKLSALPLALALPDHPATGLGLL